MANKFFIIMAQKINVIGPAEQSYAFEVIKTHPSFAASNLCCNRLNNQTLHASGEREEILKYSFVYDFIRKVH